MRQTHDRGTTEGIISVDVRVSRSDHLDPALPAADTDGRDDSYLALAIMGAPPQGWRRA